MSVTSEELAAFADGELAEPRRSQVAAEVAQDEMLSAALARHLALKERLGAHFAPIVNQSLPDKLTAPLGGVESKVVDLTTMRQRREARRGMLGWGWIAAPALAASLALALFLPDGSGTPDGYAGQELAVVLNQRLVDDQAPDEDVRVLLSFHDEGGSYCRAFAGSQQSGIACRDETGWQLRFEGAGAAAQGTDYRMAGAGAAEVLEHAQSMAAGPALDAQQEREARESGWR